MAKKVKGPSTAARPGQKRSVAANQATDRLKKAQDLYDEVESNPQGPDLKHLISQVKGLAEQQSKQEQRLTKKQIKNLKTELDREAQLQARKEKLLQAEAEVAAEEAAEKEQELKEREDDLKTEKVELPKAKKEKEKKKKKEKEVSDFDKALTDFRTMLDKKRKSLQTLSGKDTSKLKAALLGLWQLYQKLKTKVNDPDGSKLAAADKHGNVDEMLKDYKREIDAMDLMAQRNDRQLAAHKARHPDAKPTGYDDLYQSKFSKFLALGRDEKGGASLSRSMMKAAAMFGRSLQNSASKLKPSELYGSGVSWALSKAGSNPKAINAILKVDKSLRWVGENVKDLGISTAQWLHKSMSDIFGYLKRKWSSLSSGEGMGALGKLVGLGALFTSLIQPLLDGINTELEKRYGKDYIQTFIKSLWASAKSWLIDGLKNFFLGGKKLADMKPGTPEYSAKLIQGEMNPMKTSKPKYFATNWAASQSNAKQEELLQDYVDNYNNETDPVDKQGFLNALQFFVAGGNGINLKTVRAPLYDQIKATGIDVSHIKRGGATTERMPAAAAPATAFSSPIRAAGVANPVVSRGAGAAVKATAPAVTAPVAPKTVAPPSGQRAGASSPGVGPGLGNANISNKGVRDDLHLINGGTLVAH